MHDKIKATLVAGSDVGRGGSEELLGDDPSLRPDGFAGHTNPGPFHDSGATGEGAATRACEGVVPVGVQPGAAAGSGAAGAAMVVKAA